jgi:outer membrane beta-barrel protein
MNFKLLRHVLLTSVQLSALLVPCAGWAQQDAKPAATEQIVVPEVTRRDIQLPQFPSNDFDVGVFAGTYSTQNFGASAVGGLRVGYNITEDFFVQAVLAQTKVSDASFRQILPGGIFPNETEKLRYYDLSLGYNVLPGEIFIGAKRALPFTFYVIGGVGSTSLDDQKHATVNVGSGMRLFFNDYFSLHVDARDHIFTMDLLGERQRTQNLELTIGALVSF